ncbi:NUDIX domain-containing protein [Candidatus Microgenomates bacterium]|nr:NUDIX domain-containing protein [Candidatus Microgenomates bacterium]
MQTSFYTSGFLYSPKTHQILLLKSQKGDTSLWSMLGGDSLEGEEALAAFQRIINKSLNINLKPKDIYPVYDYFHITRNKLNFVFYAEVKSTKKFNGLKKGNLSWLTFSETLKLPFTAQTKQDIVVGERVINARLRDIEAKKLQISVGVSGQKQFVPR